MSVFKKTTKKVQKHYKIARKASQPPAIYNETVEICPNLDTNGCMKEKFEKDKEHFHCQLCPKWKSKEIIFKSRSSLVSHIKKNHESRCPTCKLEFKSWKQVNHHVPFCAFRSKWNELDSLVLKCPDVCYYVRPWYPWTLDGRLYRMYPSSGEESESDE